jgi:ABC-type branched-subunit amino acid transport system substrate-binding protein
VLRAQPRTIKVWMVEPVSGPMADVGQDSRLGAQIAVEAANMDATGYANYRKPETQRVAAEFARRSDGRNFDASASYPYDAILVIADVLERAVSTDPDAIVAAIKQTSFAGGLSVQSGPIVFKETGDNSNTSTAMLQVLGQKTRVVWPKDVAEQRFVFPRPEP